MQLAIKKSGATKREGPTGPLRHSSHNVLSLSSLAYIFTFLSANQMHIHHDTRRGRGFTHIMHVIGLYKDPVIYTRTPTEMLAYLVQIVVLL